MKHVSCRSFICLFVLCSVQAYAVSWEENATIGELFEQAGVKGTFVAYDSVKQTFVGHDQMRANKQYIPASTFKIPNSLIGLAVGAVKNVDEVLPYGGKPQPYEMWEHDMSLQKAITISNVPIYQELARRVGLEQMQENVIKLSYGNQSIGSVVDRFWLDGPLKISAIEQVQFLTRLAKKELCLPKNIQQSVQEIIQIDRGEDWVLYGKTGWGNTGNLDIGWWVGWVQKRDRVYAFALNIDIIEASDADKRLQLGKAALRLLGML